MADNNKTNGANQTQNQQNNATPVPAGAPAGMPAGAPMSGPMPGMPGPMPMRPPMPMHPPMPVLPPKYPLVDRIEDEKNYYILADLPGMTKDQINVEKKDHMLVISGERHSRLKAQDFMKPQDTNELKLFPIIECYSGKFERPIPIPENGDIDTFKTKYDNGILEITIKKGDAKKTETKKTETKKTDAKKTETKKTETKKTETKKTETKKTETKKTESRPSSAKK